MYNLCMKKSKLLSGSILNLRTDGNGWWEYLDGENELFQKFNKFANTPRFTAGELPVSYRVINHWAKFGLLPEGIGSKGSWRKFTFIESVWIAVASHLREFGVPLEKLAKAREQLLAFHDGYKSYIYFEFYISQALSTKNDAFVLLLADGSADVGTLEEIELNKHGKQEHNDLILISLKGVLQKMNIKVSPTNVAESLVTKQIINKRPVRRE
jgi:DNA-binding transcriptional MerR regulator